MTRIHRKRHHSFITEILGAAALTDIADLLFYGHRPAATLGAFALGLAGPLSEVGPDVRRRVAPRSG